MSATMSETSVEASFDVTGAITPRRFEWHGRQLSVEGVGRCWKQGAERCFLVLAAGGHPFELRMDETSFRWRVAPAKRKWAG